MTRFRKHIEAAREEHQATQYEGDLAEVLVAEPAAPTPRRVRWAGAGLLAAAACWSLLLSVPEEQDPGEEPIAKATPSERATPVAPRQAPRIAERNKLPWSTPKLALSAGRLSKSPATTSLKNKRMRLVGPVGRDLGASRRRLNVFVAPRPQRRIGADAQMSAASRQRLASLVSWSVSSSESGPPFRGQRASPLRRQFGAASLSMSGRLDGGRS